MIPKDEALWILSHVDPWDVARRTWRESVAAGGNCHVAAVLDLEIGRIRINYWPSATNLPPDSSNVVLATVTPARREALEREAARGAMVPPSPEVVEEQAVRHAVRQGLDWADIAYRIRLAYRIRGGRDAA